MVSKEEFGFFVESLITPQDKQEINSKKKHFIIRMMSIMVAIAAFIVVVSYFVLIPSINTLGSLVVMVCSIAIFVAVLLSVLIKSLKDVGSKYLMSKYKVEIVNYLMNSFVKYVYNPQMTINRKDFEQLRVCGGFDEFSGEDLLTITIPVDSGDVELNLSDCKAIERVRDKEGREYVRTVYNGIAGFIVFPFKFKCKLALNNRYHFRFKDVESYNLEDIKFNNRFSFKTNDQFEATHILTPSLMMKLMKIEQHFKRFGLVLDGNLMVISVPHQQLFAPRSIKKDNYVEAFYPFYEDIVSITEIITEIVANKRVIDSRMVDDKNKN